MSEYFERMHAAGEEQLRANPDLRLADLPMTYFMPGTQHLTSSLRVPIYDVVDFLVDQGSSAVDLTRTAVYVYPMEGKASDMGVQHDSPKVFDNEVVHYPVVGLGVPRTGAPNVRRVNSTLRHELGHILQENDTETRYNRPVARHIARSVGAVAALGFAKWGLEGGPDAAATMLKSTAALISGATALDPMSVLHYFEPREIDADVFAWRHRDFKPITLDQ
jgi:hypothetical protein